MKRFLLPLLLFFVLAGFLAVGLRLNPRDVPSPLIDKPAPAFALPALSDPTQTLRRDDLLGKVWMLNVWASWCTACRQEHPVLLEFSRQQQVPIYGLNYKDERLDAQALLDADGNPYTESLVDYDGRTGIDFGVYGVPETFIIDKAGVIRFKHTGPITPEVLEKDIQPMLRKLNA